MYMQLKIILEPSDEGGFTVYVPSLPGCISEGDTEAEAIESIREAIEEQASVLVPLLVGGRLLGAILSFLVHGLAVVLVFWWSSGHSQPPSSQRPVIFIDMGRLVRKGRLPTKREKKLLPRLQSKPDPPPEEAIHLGKLREEKKKREEEEKKKREEERRKARDEQRRRRKKMRQALARLDRDKRRPKSIDDLPIGRPDGDELGSARKGAMKRQYVHLVGATLDRAWEVYFLPPEVLRILHGKVKITSDRHGVIRQYGWVQRSPNPDFNSSVESCLKRFTQEGDRRLPPFPDDHVFEDPYVYIMNFKPKDR